MREGKKYTNNVNHFEDVTLEMRNLYEKKNKDYGDSFAISFQEEGMAMARIRLSDKLNRFKTLTRSNKQEIKDESIRDTLIDLANYAIMTVMEMDKLEKASPEENRSVPLPDGYIVENGLIRPIREYEKEAI